MSKFDALREEAWHANMEIAAQGLAVYTFGNASAWNPDLGSFAIKPSGVPYSELSPTDMVIVDADGRVVEGRLRPSSDTPTHAVLYRSFKGIGGVCHTHSVYAVAWAQACRPIPILGTTHADHLAAEVPVTTMMSDEAVGRDYEEETGNLIVEACRGLDPTKMEMVLVAGHGPFTWGKDAAQAVYHGRVLEEIAKMAYLTLAIDPNTAPLKPSIQKKHYDRKHGTGAYYGQT